MTKKIRLKFKEKDFHLLFLPFAGASVAEAFRERIVVNFELRDFLVLIGGDRDELRLLEHVRPKRRVGKLEDVVRPD